ncbi:hypothetical protein HPB48_011536 [Haemaphysalis longicornis]|uniref:Uncharacterized protein n=1 Tax=Haemaphysalis longicornis TaxID=44386 RepID=A0A9J6GXN6_HAELO|nr:hypothetical protein HPB48_011536 [Haemaphysalis longicornis]
METKLWEELEAEPDYLPPPALLRHSPTSAPHLIVGYEGFGLKPYLMRPYHVADLKRAKKNLQLHVILPRVADTAKYSRSFKVIFSRLVMSATYGVVLPKKPSG